MATVRELINLIGFKVNDGQLKTAEKKVAKFKQKLKDIGKVVGLSILAIGAVAIKAASDMEMLNTQFEVMLGSAEKAADLMEELKEFAATTPFALNDLAKGTQNLLAFGVPLEEVVDTMRMLGDTAGGNREKLNSLVLAFGKVQTKGKVSMEEINMIAERGVPIIGTLVDQLGVTEQQFFKLVSAGKIGREEIKQAFKTMTSEGGIFFEGMKKQSLTFAGLVSTMRDNITLVLAEIGGKLLPTMKIVVQKITELFQGSLGQIIANLLSVINPLLESVLRIVEVLATQLTPIIDTLSRVLIPLLEIVQSLMPLIETLIEAILGLVNELVGELASDLIPLFKEVATLLSSLTPILVPILKIMFQLFAIFFKMNTFLPRLLFKIMVKGLTLALKVINKIFEVLNKVFPLFELLGKVFETIANFIQNVFDSILNGVFMAIDFVFDMLNKVIEQINKLPFMQESQIKPFDREALQKELLGGGDNITTKTTNLNMQNQFNFSGISGKDDLKRTMKQAVGTPFQIELKRIIQSTL